MSRLLGLVALVFLLGGCDDGAKTSVSDTLEVAEDQVADEVPGDGVTPCELWGAAEAQLVDGVCTVVSCEDGYFDCQPEDPACEPSEEWNCGVGCESLGSTWNCGGCGVVCGPNQVCGVDGCEATSVVCTRDLLDGITPTPAQFAATNLAMPQGFVITQHQAAKAATFSNSAAAAYGFIVLSEAGGADPQKEFSDKLVAVLVAGNAPIVNFSQLFTLPDAIWDRLESFPVELEVTGVRARMAYRYGAGSPNESVSSKDPAALRDEIVSAISGQPVSVGESSAPCEEISVSWLTELRADNSLLSVALLTCAANLETDEPLEFVFEDLLSGTILAPGNFNPVDFKCDELESPPPPPRLDILWVIGNSGTMAGDHVALANMAQEFVQLLNVEGLDWRIGVTTTEAYGLVDGLPSGATLDHDELLDLQTGLRGAGFISAADPDAAALFDEYMFRDDGCLRLDSNGAPVAPENTNVCGDPAERGLESGAVVLERALVDERPAYALRPDARRVVVWVSDQEDQAVEGLTDADAGWAPIIDGYVNRYDALGAEGYALVGGEDPTCDAEPGLSYVEAAFGTRGGMGGLCGDSVIETLNAMGMRSAGAWGNTQLTGYPISSSIRVAVDGVVVPRSYTQGWNYDAATNSIVFFGLNLTPLSRISVAYLIWEKREG